MKLQGIQYLRAIAVIAVVFDHAAAMAKFEKYFGQKVPLYDFLTAGGLGVNLFFVISGFIIVVSSFSGQDFTPKRSLSGFLVARAVRILPLMWIAIASYATLRFLGRGTFDFAPYINAAVLLPFGDYDPNNIWTLRHEMIFYIVFGLCFLSGRQRLFTFASWSCVPFLLLVLSAEYAYKTGNPLIETVSNIFSPLNFLFAAGALVGYAYIKFPAYFTRTIWHTGPNAIQWIMPILLLSGCMIFAGGDFKSKEVILATTPIFVAMVAYGATQTRSVPLLTYLGNASFAIYLFHPHFESALLGLLARVHPTMSVSIAVVTCGVLSILASCVIYSLVEAPLTSTLSRFSDLPSNRRPAAT